MKFLVTAIGGDVGQAIAIVLKRHNPECEIVGSDVKNIASNLPYIGNAAGQMINKYEGQANAYAKKNIGVNFGDVDKVVSTADRIAKYLPSS